MTIQPKFALFTRLLAALLVVPANACAAESPLTSHEQQVSYTLGLEIASNILRQGIELDADAFSLAVQDVLAGKSPRLTPAAMQAAMAVEQQRGAEQYNAIAARNLEKGQAFLAANRAKEGVKETASGLQYKVLKGGQGAKPSLTDTLEVHYVGTLTDGTEFDSSRRRGEPITIQLGQVVKGWQEALQLMPVGSHWQIFLPTELGYGLQGSGGAIQPNQALVFDIELLGIK